MAKSRRATRARISVRRVSGSRKQTRAGRSRQRTRRVVASVPAASATFQQIAEIRPTAQKHAYAEAVGLYERGLQALQRRDFHLAATTLRTVIERYPAERELVERAGLYLKVCERELTPASQRPLSTDERVYAATVALNAGEEAAALQHLDRALAQNPRHHHAHYMMAVAHARRNAVDLAVRHLARSIDLNPQNRGIAAQDPDLEQLRAFDAFDRVVNRPINDSERDQRLGGRPKDRF